MGEAADFATELADLAERMEVWAFDRGHEDAPAEDLIRLHAVLSSMNWANGRLTSLDRTIRQRLDHQLAEAGMIEVDGQMWALVPDRAYRELDRDALRSAVNRWATEDRLDKDTGEVHPPTTEEVLDRIWTVADVATGRTGKLRKGPGIWLEDYAGVVDETSKVQVVDPNTMKPPKGDPPD